MRSSITALTTSLFSILFSFVLHAQKELRPIKKMIPCKKIKNLNVVDQKKDWYAFKHKTGYGIWDKASGKLLFNGPKPFFVIPSLGGLTLIYTSDSTYIHSSDAKKAYGVATVDTNYQVLSDGRFYVRFYSQGSFHFSDSLTQFGCVVDRTPDDILFQAYTVPETNYQKLVDLTTNKVVIDLNGWYLSRGNNGYVCTYNSNEFNDLGIQEIQIVYYDTSYRQLNEPINKSELSDPEKLGNLLSLKIDSVRVIDYNGLYFYSGGKWGAFDAFKGLIMEPRAELILKNDLASVYLENGRLGMINPISNFHQTATFEMIDVRGGWTCESVIKADGRFFYAYYTGGCEIFEGIFEHQRKDYDSLEMYYQNSTSLTCTKILDDWLIHSYGYQGYHIDENSLDYEGWYTMEGNSGIYSLSQKKWLLEPNNYSVDDFGPYFLIGAAHQENLGGKYYLIDRKFQRISNKQFISSIEFADHLVLTDSSGYHYLFSKSGELEPFGDSIINKTPMFEHGFLCFGHYYHNEYNYWMPDKYVVDVFYDKEFKPMTRVAGMDLEKFLEYGYAVLYDDKNLNFVLYDLTNKKEQNSWSGDWQELGYTLQIGSEWEGEVNYIDLRDLRSHE